MDYPRYVHGNGPGGEHLKVNNQDELDAAVAKGYLLEPWLSDEQKAAVKQAKLAAGELVEDEADGKKKGKK